MPLDYEELAKFDENYIEQKHQTIEHSQHKSRL